MSLFERYIHISGSANEFCSTEKLIKAHEFVQAFVTKVLELGGNFVVFIGKETKGEKRPVSKTLDKTFIFDWTILTTLGVYLSQKKRKTQIPAIIVTSKKALDSDIPKNRLNLLRKLSNASAVKTVYIADENHTGGNIRKKLVQSSHAFVALSGGKGVANIYPEFKLKQSPIIPFDLDLGSYSDDGNGAIELNKKAFTEPSSFFPFSQQKLRDNLFSLSLEKANNVGDIAKLTSELLGEELLLWEKNRTLSTIKKHYDIAIVTALSVEEKAILQISPSVKELCENYYETSVHSVKTNQDYEIVIACLGTCGNNISATEASRLIHFFRPKLLIMVGIAGGFKDKCNLGDVLISESIVAYEPASLEKSEKGRSKVVPRPKTFNLAHTLQQDITSYISSDPTSQLTKILENEKLLPSTNENVISELCPRLAFIASGEKLFRDGNKLKQLRSKIHGKIEAVEMEAAGVAVACEKNDTHWLIIRGISDFAGVDKDDNHHDLAANAAAIVTIDFIREGLSLN